MTVKVSFPGSVWDGTNRVTQKNANARRAPERTFQFSRSDVIRFGQAIDGTRDRLIVATTPVTNNMEVFATINWKELS